MHLMIARLPTSSNAAMKNYLPYASIGPVQGAPEELVHAGVDSPPRVSARSYQVTAAEDPSFRQGTLRGARQQALDRCDGIYGPEMDRLLKFDVFAPPAERRSSPVT